MTERSDHDTGSIAGLTVRGVPTGVPGGPAGKASGPSGQLPSQLPGQRVDDGASGSERFPPLLLQLNPFIVLDQVLRSLVPGYREQLRLITRNGLTRHAGPHPAPLLTRAEAAERVGLAPDDLGRLWRALGFAEPADAEPGYTEADVEVVRAVGELAAEGVVDVDQVITMVRPMGHLVSRLGAAQVSALSGLHPGDSDQVSATSRPAPGEATDRLVPMLEGLVVHAWRRHLATAASAAIPVRRLEKASAPQTVGFIDMTSYTTLSRRIRWAELARLLDRFEATVFDRVADYGGQVVKTLGDEVMFVVQDAAAGAAIALAVADDASTDSRLPSVHAGLAYGPLLERAGDVFGPTVNVASRVTDLARAGTVLIDGAFQQMIDGDRRFRTLRRPRRPVRGYSSLITYRLQHGE